MSLQNNRTFVDTPHPQAPHQASLYPNPLWSTPSLALAASQKALLFPHASLFPLLPLSSPTCPSRLHPNATSSGKTCPLFPGSRLGAPWGWMVPAMLIGIDHERTPRPISLPSLAPRLVFLPPQRIRASTVAPGLQYFGMSMAGGFDISGDGLADITVGTLGQAVVFR